MFGRFKDAEAGGYVVCYGDNYLSYSPQKAFEEGYVLDEIPVEPQEPAPESVKPKAAARVVTICRMVIYRLSFEDAEQINRRRTSGKEIAERMKTWVPTDLAPEGEGKVHAWPAGAQAHIGERVAEGSEFPAIVVRVKTDGTVNLQVLLDGNDVFWAEMVVEGNGPGMWRWPV